MKILLEEGLTWREQKKAVEMSLFLGFQNDCAEFPVVSRDEGISINTSFEEIGNMYKKTNVEPPKDYVSATKHATEIPDFDWRKKKGLETLFTTGFFLKDSNFDLLPDELNFKIRLQEESSYASVFAACNLAFRFGMETTAYCGEILEGKGYVGNIICFEDASRCGIRLEKIGEYYQVVVEGSGKELEGYIASICENFPLLPKGQTWIDILQEMADGINQATSLLVPKEKPRKVYEREYDIPWEVDVFRSLMEQNVYLNLKAGDQVQVYGALSEEQDVRNELVQEIKEKIEEKGGKLENSQLICAYKQGFSWIEEVILPQLKKKDKLKRIQIGFKPFLPEGVTEWLDEDGATPSYNNVQGNTPDKWFDLPIRFLQELYPIEDIISDTLSIPREEITFTTYETSEDMTYKFQAFDSEEEEIFEERLKVSYTERPYLNEYPQMGKVHPLTGYVKVLVNGSIVLENNVATDMECIWNIYQDEVLPDCKAYIEEKMGNTITIENQPFFSKLEVEVTASEPDRRLSCREDLISTLDALHEDMYFVGSDYFKNYGIQKVDAILDAPGLILPVIKRGEGKPKFKVTLYDQEKKNNYIKARQKTELYISSLSIENGEETIYLQAEAEEELVKKYVSLLNERAIRLSQGFTGVDRIVFCVNQNRYMVEVEQYVENKKDLQIDEIDLLEHTLIGYKEYLEIIEKLKRVAEILVYQVATSYEGRAIYAIELLPEKKGYLSRTKRITNLPSEFINARHHANEVSGTNAAFILLKKLLTEEKYKELPEKLNLVIVPMENVDGTAIHYELQKENPYWKLHVARFNATGKEFYYEHFKPDTIYTEAMGLTRIWKKYLPDIIVDNHGVPSHEWEQQFSGYTSPSFKGFWLPRSLLYGYFWTVKDEVYKSNYLVNKKMEDIIAEAMGADKEIKEWNKEWMARFEKYAHSWMPKLFPANYYKDMINYWIPFDFDPTHRYPSIRFPWITTVAYTSEVADETAQGDYLNLCARAHVTHDLATIDMLMNCKCIFEECIEVTDTNVSVSRIRQRPIVV